MSPLILLKLLILGRAEGHWAEKMKKGCSHCCAMRCGHTAQLHCFLRGSSGQTPRQRTPPASHGCCHIGRCLYGQGTLPTNFSVKPVNVYLTSHMLGEKKKQQILTLKTSSNGESNNSRSTYSLLKKVFPLLLEICTFLLRCGWAGFKLQREKPPGAYRAVL